MFLEIRRFVPRRTSDRWPLLYQIPLRLTCILFGKSYPVVCITWRGLTVGKLAKSEFSDSLRPRFDEGHKM